MVEFTVSNEQLKERLMKVSKIIKMLEVIEGKRVPNDILEGKLYHSASLPEPIQINDMDLVHLIRAFKSALHKLDNQWKED